MQIIWKSGVDLKQLEDRIKKGAKALELHLLESDLDNLDELEKRLENYIDKIEIVHIPIDDRFSIEGLHSTKNKHIIIKSCQIAQRISKRERIIDVVFHQQLSLNKLKICGIYDSILHELYCILCNYPNIVINLENLTVMGMTVSNENYYKGGKTTRDSYFLETLHLCEILRKNLITDRIGLVWDVCHGVSTERILKTLIDINYIEDLSYENYLRRYLPYLNIIHLSNTRGFGYGKGHGTIFESEEEIKELEHIINLIEKHNYNKKITLEVWEHNYTDVAHCVLLDRQIKELLQKNKERGLV